MDAFTQELKPNKELTPLEKMSSVIDLAVGRLKIPPHKRDHFFQEIKNLAKSLADKNTGDDDIRDMITSHVLPELPLESDAQIANFITECVKATIDYRKELKFKEKEE